MLRSVELVTDVSGQPIAPILKGQTVQEEIFLDSLTLNVSNIELYHISRTYHISWNILCFNLLYNTEFYLQHILQF